MAIERPAVFLERDGILVERVHDDAGGTVSPRTLDEMVLRRHAGQFVRQLNALGYVCLVVSNQPGVARGILTLERLGRLDGRLTEMLRERGATLAGIYNCPHLPDSGPTGRPEFTRQCPCRKPAPGLLLRAATDHYVDLRRSFMVGDSPRDVGAGLRAGVTTLWVGDPRAIAAQQLEWPEARAHRIVPDLLTALAVITAEREQQLGADG